MQKLNIGYTSVSSTSHPPARLRMPIRCHEVELDHELETTLCHLIQSQLMTALSTLHALPKGKWKEDIFYLDIPMILEDGTGLLQQVKHLFDGKYLETIEGLDKREQNPIFSFICRFELHEHMTWEGCRLHFQMRFFINGKKTKTTIGL